MALRRLAVLLLAGRVARVDGLPLPAADQSSAAAAVAHRGGVGLRAGVRVRGGELVRRRRRGLRIDRKTWALGATALGLLAAAGVITFYNLCYTIPDIAGYYLTVWLILWSQTAIVQTCQVSF